MSLERKIKDKYGGMFVGGKMDVCVMTGVLNERRFMLPIPPIWFLKSVCILFII